MGNWLLDEAGHVWAIDFGMARLQNPRADVSLWLMEQTRDLYHEQYPEVLRMDELLRSEDMWDEYVKISQADRYKFKELVLKNLPEIADTEAPAIVETLVSRKGELIHALKPYEHAPPAPAAPVEQGWVLPVPQNPGAPQVLAPAA